MAERFRTFHVHPDPVREAARLFGLALETVYGREGRARLAVAGGSAARVLGSLRREAAPELWRGVRLAWVDERCVPQDHPDSNRGAAYRAGHLDLADPPALELPLFQDGETLAAACARVQEALIRDFQGGLDILLLGLGEDGHIASLFPGRPFSGPLNEAVFPVEDCPKPPPRRITLSLPMLGTAGAAVMLASGESKRWALERLRQGDPALPASALPFLDVVTD